MAEKKRLTMKRLVVSHLMHCGKVLTEYDNLIDGILNIVAYAYNEGGRPWDSLNAMLMCWEEAEKQSKGKRPKFIINKVTGDPIFAAALQQDYDPDFMEEDVPYDYTTSEFDPIGSDYEDLDDVEEEEDTGVSSALPPEVSLQEELDAHWPLMQNGEPVKGNFKDVGPPIDLGNPETVRTSLEERMFADQDLIDKALAEMGKMPDEDTADLNDALTDYFHDDADETEVHRFNLEWFDISEEPAVGTAETNRVAELEEDNKNLANTLRQMIDYLVKKGDADAIV